VTTALDAAGKPYENHVFEEAGHGFFCDARASYHEPSAKEAWELTLAFLSKNLGVQ
jgi:carboxymethylenebutenolidase